jgi:hypothetical protein
MSTHPYRDQPTRAFWSRAVATNFDATQLPREEHAFFTAEDRVVTAGSCFAANLIPWVEASGASYVRAEPVPEQLAELPENLGYRTFSAAYGNIYTARHLLQLLRRAYGEFTPVEDRWYEGEDVIDPFRPGLAYPAGTDGEFDLLTAKHLAAVRTAVESASVFVFTLGLTEAWRGVADGAVYPSCPGTVRGTFDATRHEFVNFGVNDVRDDLIAAISLARRHNPTLRFVLTVSPVPLVATATDQHVVVATTYSKSVLRVAAEEVTAQVPGVRYFPAYEIVTGPQAPEDFFEPDRRNVSPKAVTAVMSVLLGLDLTGVDVNAITAQAPIVSQEGSLSHRLIQAECDEVMAER